MVSAASGYAGGFASLLGADEGSFSFDESYAVWALPSFAGAFGDYASLYGTLGGEGADSASALVGGAAWGCCCCGSRALSSSCWARSGSLSPAEGALLWPGE